MRPTPIVGLALHFGFSQKAQLDALHALWCADPKSVGRAGPVLERRLWTGDPPVLVVNNGRYLHDCPNPDCHDGPLAEPTWNASACFACGYYFDALDMPAMSEIVQVEIAMRERKPHQMQWDPRFEDARDISDENARHGKPELEAIVAAGRARPERLTGLRTKGTPSPRRPMRFKGRG